MSETNNKFICLKCGKEYSIKPSFCGRCGYKFEKTTDIAKVAATGSTERQQSNNVKEDTELVKNFWIGFGVLVFIFLVVVGIAYLVMHVDSKSLSKPTSKPNKIENKDIIYDLQTPSKVLAKIDLLQAQYFSIIKRNDAFLKIYDCDACAEDMEDLNKLFSEVRNNIDKDNYYLKKYDEIENSYSSSDLETTAEINNFMMEYYEAVDKLLNETYQAVRTKIPREDFKNLIASELKWLKDVEQYHKVFEQQEYGSIRTWVNLRYEINMRQFRPLLLMLYFAN